MATKELVSTPYGYGEIDAVLAPTPDQVIATDPGVSEQPAFIPAAEPIIHKVTFRWGGVGYLPV